MRDEVWEVSFKSNVMRSNVHPLDEWDLNGVRKLTAVEDSWTFLSDQQLKDKKGINQ